MFDRCEILLKNCFTHDFLQAINFCEMQKVFSRLQPAIGLGLLRPSSCFLGPKCRITAIGRTKLAELSFQRISYNALQYSSYHKCIFTKRIQKDDLKLTEQNKMDFCECGTFSYTPTLITISSGWLNKRYFSNEPRNNQSEMEEKKDLKEEELQNIPQKEDDKKKIGAFGRFRAMVAAFLEGCKQLLWIDARKAWATKKKLKRHDYDLTILTREELRHMQQTQKDIIKSLPVALLFFLPFVGYLAPIIGYLFPKKLLSQQFWNIEQRKKFAFEDHAKRSQYYLPLIQELGWSSRELKNRDLFKLCIKAIDGNHIKNEELIILKDDFKDEIMMIKKMPRFHLTKLCKTWLLPVKWYVPSKVLREFLSYRIKQIVEDDQAIRRDGMDILSDKCIRQACHARGLDKYSFEIPVMKQWLDDWLSLTEPLTVEDKSFIAHCAAIKTMNFGKEVEEQQIAQKTGNQMHR